MSATPFYIKHKLTLEAALQACEQRHYWSPFVESPSGKLHPEGSAKIGKEAFDSLLNKPFVLEQPGEIGRVGNEVSPYTCKPLGISYPKVDVNTVFDAAATAKKTWQVVPHAERAGICLEMAFALEKQCFANAHATMHSAGQSYLMAFSGSGANALDRGVEAIAYAFKALNEVRPDASWTKSFGRAGEVTLDKTYRLMPRGTAVVIGCATFPLWNAYPALFANLVTANPVIIKPHPNGILPVAMAVKTCRRVLEHAGYDPNLVMLAADEVDQPITIDLLQHPDCAIVDYTGSQRFGRWIEENCADKLVYTETAGCNGVVIESTDDLDGLINGLANSLCGFSAQMCTSPQNIHLPDGGVETEQGHISFDDFVAKLSGAIQSRTENPDDAARLCAAIQSEQSIKIIEQVRDKVKTTGQLVLDSKPYIHPDFPDARTATPMLCVLDSSESGLIKEEHFAPIGFVVRELDADAALAHATTNARDFGAISSYLYSVNADFLDQAKDAFAEAGASLWCNMTAAMPINFAAAYSDYHVTGLNPAGNACLTDLAFVANRFRIVQFREPAANRAVL